MPHSDANLSYAWLIPILPLLGFLFNGFFGTKVPKKVSGGLATAAVFGSFAIAVSLFLHVLSMPDGSKQILIPGFNWLDVPAIAGLPAFHVNYELLLDPLSALMMLIITGVGGLIHLYSTGYMAADKGYSRFFTYLNLFIFFMLLLVMGNNFLVLFIGWEGVGLCSYLLIGYFYEKQSAGDAAKKAFIMNRIGDVGVLIGMFMIFHYFGTLDFYHTDGLTGIVQAAHTLPVFATTALITTMMLMLFLGATGKSAQIPLYTWLPDAMEGPTPVSALIHAATMVTAGVYMVSRAHSLFELSSVAMETICVIGIATAIFAATIGLMQNDIKRVLAYSTVSQLGYMFAACGAGVFAAGMYHVMTHAFFKACLFLGSGSVIHAIEHAMHAKHGHDAEAHDEAHEAHDEAHEAHDEAHEAHDEAHEAHDEAHEAHDDSHDIATGGVTGPDPNDPQDMRNMGGLLKRTPVTAATMMIATLAIAGMFPFAGYFSKGEILWSVWQYHAPNWVIWGIGAVTALITAFYMTRLVVKTFFGPPRTDAAKTANESSFVIVFPLVVLAALSFFTGWAIIPFKMFEHYLAPSVVTEGYLPPIMQASMQGTLELGLLIGIIASIVGCFAVYQGGKVPQLQSEKTRADRRILSPGWIHWVILNKYFVDELYNFLFVKLGKKVANFLWLTFDDSFVDGIVNGAGRLTDWSGEHIRRIQTGYVRNYAMSMVIGILVVLIGCIYGFGHGH